MPNVWAIQNSGLTRRDDAEERLLKGLAGTRTAIATFGVIPFEKTIVGHEGFPDMPMFPHCSTKALRILTAQDLRPTDIFISASPELAEQHRRNLRAGIFYDLRRFDQAYYMLDPTVRSILLNGDGEVRLLKDVKHTPMNREVFVKPTKDLKLFAGVRVLPGRTIDETVNEGLVDIHYRDGDEETVLIAPIKEVLREWRFFVVNGEVVTGSQYMTHGAVKPSSDIPRYVTAEAQELAQVYQPTKAFTMDLCLTAEAEIKVVEYNCINCSGFYHSNIFKLAEALRDL